MPEPLYLPPGAQVSQGDIYLFVPSSHVERRPLQVIRPLRTEKGGLQSYRVHSEDGDAPSDGFKWDKQDGERLLVRGYLRMGILVSHDCEIDSDTRHRILAMVRPITDLQPEHRQAVVDNEQVCALPLAPQDREPQMALSFVDFRRLTTVRPDVLAASNRYASLSSEIRKALAEWFWEYLFRGEVEGRVAQ